MKPSDLNCSLQLTSIPQAKELRIAEKREIPYWTLSHCLDMHSIKTINSEQCSQMSTQALQAHLYLS